MKYFIEKFWLYYLITLSVVISLFFLGCSTCPGSKNLAYPQFYTGFELMHYAAGSSCMLSKMDSGSPTLQDTYAGTINQIDSLIFMVDDNDMVRYIHLFHRDTDQEKMHELLGKYIQYARLYGTNYKYTAGKQFTVNYLEWKVQVYQRPNALEVIGRKVEVQ